MNSPIATNPSNNLSEQLRQLGLRAIPVGLDGFLARAAKSRWSPRQLLEFLVREESGDRARRSLERRLQVCGAKRFKPIADFDWTWPKKIERDVIERALALVAKNLCHTAVLAGHSVLLRSASARLEDLHRQSPEGRRRRLRTYANVDLLCIDEAGLPLLR